MRLQRNLLPNGAATVFYQRPTWRIDCRSLATSQPASLKEEDLPSPPVAGTPRRQHRLRPRFLTAVSPNRTLGLWLENKSDPSNPELWPAFPDVARSRSLRSPLVALQLQLKRQQESAELSSDIADELPSGAEWGDKLASLEKKGISKEDIDHWLWIMSPDDPAVRVQRLVSSDRPKPPFVLLSLLRKDVVFSHPRPLVSLFDYIAQTYCQPPPSDIGGGRADMPRRDTKRTFRDRRNMAPQTFVLLIRRLVRHCLRSWPSAIVTVGRLVSQYLANLPRPSQTSKVGRRGVEARLYQHRCFVFNSALAAFAWAPAKNPVAQMKFNWRAQKVLLAASTEFSRALLIDREGFRAIRRTLIGLRKSVAEQSVAARLSMTWPPYRRDFDGLDEQRRPEDDLSRSVKAGIMMHEAGYADGEHDVAMSALGGAIMGESPTVQTRALPPKVWTGKRANLNIYSTWVARLQATRNAHEAWQMFQRPPSEGLRPNIQVYSAMFEKLLAREVDLSPKWLPGDGKEVLPVYQANLSEFEKVRIRPPGVWELYALMRQDNIRPVGRCLTLLITHTTSLEELRRLLDDSPVDKRAARAFLLAVDDRNLVNPVRSPIIRDSLKSMPIGVFDACVAMICEIQPIDRTYHGHSLSRNLHRIRNAISLARMRVPFEASSKGRTWRVLLHALSRFNIAVCLERGPDYARRNRLEVLRLFLEVYEMEFAQRGLDIDIFDRFCLVTRRLIKFGGDEVRKGGGGIIEKVHHMLKSAFAELTEPVNASDVSRGELLELPPLFFRLSPIHVQKYISTLGHLGDIEEMVRVVRWMIDSWEGTIFEDARDPTQKQHNRVGMAFTVFRAFAENQIEPQIMRELEVRLARMSEEEGCTWGWPSKLEAQDYVETERRRSEGASTFWDKAREYLRDR